MELASMLAGERFSDHPDAVCPVIASLLRTYNDMLPDGRRQDLYRYAAAAVGTRSTPAVEDIRIARMAHWAAAVRERRAPWSLLPTRLRRLGLRRMPRHDSAGELLQRALRRHTAETHAAILALIDELIALGPPPASASADCELAPSPVRLARCGRPERVSV
jgi:hypothetical protein